MKKLEVIIRPFKLEEVKDALAALGIDGMTLSEVKGCGHHTTHTEIYRDHPYRVDFLPQFKVEIVLPDELVDEALQAIMRAARSGTSGDGKVFITPVDQVIRIRTEESGISAI